MSGNNAGAREVLAETKNYSGLAREQGTSLEIRSVLTQFFFSGRNVLTGGASGTGFPTNQPGRGKGTSGWGSDGDSPIRLRRQ